MIGIAYIDSLYLGTYPGTLMNTTNLYVTALGATTINAGVDSGGVLGTIVLWPDTENKGSLKLQAGDNTGDDVITLTTGNTGGNITVVLPIISGNLMVDGAAALSVGADDGTLGTLTLWPNTVNLGSFVITPADNASDYVITLTTPADSAAACTFVLPNVSGYLVAGTAQLTLAEVDVLDGVTLGTGQASKVVTLDASGHMTGIAGDWGLTSVTSIDIAAGALEIAGVSVTPIAAELNRLTGGWASITTVSETGAGGSVGVQLQFKDAAGANMTVPVCGIFYLADDSAGLAHGDVDTSVATLTNGSVGETGGTHNVVSFVTAADGTLGFTITMAADSIWAVFPGPGGLLHITDELIAD
jgi:hypothetical protein